MDKPPASFELETALTWIRDQNFDQRRKLPPDEVFKVLRRLAACPQTKLRGAALRACRHIVGADPARAVEALNRHRMHFVTVKSLEREPKYLEERMQALKLLRTMAQHAPDRIPKTLIRALIAIAEHRGDQLKEAALESVREYSLLNTRVVAQCGGIAVMVNAILDPMMVHMSDSLLLTLLHLFNQEESRVWLRSTLDVQVLLAPFTSADAEIEGEEERKTRRKLSRKAIVMMMRTWTGLSILASDPHGLRSLVQMLVQPVSYDLRKDVLDTILEIFNTINPLRASRSSQESSGGAGATGLSDADLENDDEFEGKAGAEPYMAEYWGVGPGAPGSKELAAGGFHAERVPGRHAHMHTLLDNFLVMVLLAFVQYGLVEALVELSVSSAPPMSRTATQLLSFVSRFATRLLPSNVSRRLLSQKKLVASAADAARAGDVVDRARAQRAAHVISILARIVGSGYDTALATLLSRSTYEDGLALASELALAGAEERAHLHLGVFPRSSPMPKLPLELLLDPKTLNPQGISQLPPQRANSSGGGIGSGIKKTLKRMSRRRSTANTSRGDLSSIAESARGDGRDQGDLTDLAAPLVANRGHRRFVQQLILTDMSQGKGSQSSALSDDVKRLLDKARIMIKVERREWTHWDWVAIDELISGPCQNPEICNEILKTKFFPRLSAFFGVSSNGSFAQLPWEPDCIAYTNVATSMLRLLLNAQNPGGQNTGWLGSAATFVTEDRRGRLAAQISEALLKELSHAEDADAFERAQRDAQNTLLKERKRGYFEDDEDDDDFDQTGVGTRVFTAQACSTTMARDFFVLLGVFASSANGVHLLKQLGVFNTLSRLALHREKDYILRLAISHLDYSGPSAGEPREWLQLILVNSKVSLELRLFAIGFLRSMLRSAQNQERKVAEWMLSVVFAQLKFTEVVPDVLSVLIEATHYPLYLEILVDMLEETVQGKKNEFNIHMSVLQSPPARMFLLKLLGSETGVKALKSLGLLQKIMDEWAKEEYTRYLQRIDAALLYQLVDRRKAGAGWPGTSTIPKAIPIRAHEASALSEPGFAASELQWLFRLPWRIEVWAESSMGTIRVPMDAFIDCSRLRPESVFSPGDRDTQDENIPRGICVTAVPPWSRDKDMDQRQRARPFIVAEDATVYVCLALGNQAVDRRGRSHPPPTAGGGFPYGQNVNYGRNEPADSSGYASGRESKFRSFATSKRFPATTRGGYSTAGRPSLQSDDLAAQDDDQFDGDAFAEAPGASSDFDFVRPLSDERFWIKCTPSARKAALAQKTGIEGSPGRPFSLCPPNSAVTFHFAPLDAQSHRDSTARESSHAYEREAPTEIAKPTEPEVRVVNPLLALRKDNRRAQPSGSGTSSGVFAQPNQDRSDLPPLLLLKEVRFHLDLVPQRFASPSVPVHLLGELSKSESGIAEVQSIGVMERFMRTAKDETASPLDRRAALWAIGHIGGTEIGLSRLRQLNPNVVHLVHTVATETPCVSLRGAAIYTLGFFSRHSMGCRVLHDLGWATLDLRSHPFATIAVPASSRIAPFSDYYARDPPHALIDASHLPVDGVLSSDDAVPAHHVQDEAARRVLQLISDLANHIAQKEAHGELVKVIDSNPSVFSNVKLYLAVQDLLARFSFELPVRQFVLNIFHARIALETEATWKQIDAEPYH